MEIKQFVKEKLDGLTYFHTKAVVKLALELAEKEGADKEVVEAAAWLHDIGRSKAGLIHHKESVEMSEELAAEKGIKNGEKVIVRSKRGEVTVVAIVTKRYKPFQLNGRKVHQVGIPWHWGYTGLSTGASANVLTPHVGDANTMIPEYKAFLVDVVKA